MRPVTYLRPAIAAAVLALAACGSAPAASPAPDLTVACGIVPADSSSGFQLRVSISQSPVDPSPRPVYVHTVTLDLASAATGDKYVTEKVDRWVPGSDTYGYGNGIIVTYPWTAASVPGCSSAGSWS